MRLLLVVLWLLGVPAEKPAPVPENSGKAPPKAAPAHPRKRHMPMPEPPPGQPRAEKTKTAMA
ncbi:MAG TPA: hypothetical protein VMK66_19540 [Myxococcales bacterium]|nr:hypothetical protein [Myxococcales bacterium]